MTTGTLRAQRNRNGNLVLEVVIEGGRPLSVPKAGRNDNENAILACDGKAVECTRTDGGVFTIIRCGDITIFQNGNTAPQTAAAMPAVNAAVRQDAAPVANDPPAAGVQTIAQQRARHALEAVREWEPLGRQDQKELLSYASSFPAMILMSGFGQACAFYRCKGGNHQLQFDVLAGWLHQQQVFASADLMQEIVSCNAAKYQLAQAEALAYLDWLKKFAKAYLKGDDDATTSS